MKKALDKVTVAVIARNEEATLGDLLTSLTSGAGDVILIDGHSTDRTAEIAASMGVAVYRDGGLGKGDGIRRAIEVAAGEVVVFIDADGSHDPADIPALVAPILAGDADLVVGSRWQGGSDELGGDAGKFIRSTGSAVITLAINYRFNVRLTDSQNGFRAIAVKAARTLQLTEDIFTIEQEMIMDCLRRGYRVAEVPTHEYRRQAGESQIVVWKVAHRYVWSLVKGITRK